ncbi:hypothetical protein Acsp05_56960 [Actinokineospora sp. NBRC 105648]|nr:hypothetical protein Acsp05_56960 [Actinokineospora sp. NBRC 105648]
MTAKAGRRLSSTTAITPPPPRHRHTAAPATPPLRHCHHTTAAATTTTKPQRIGRIRWHPSECRPPANRSGEAEFGGTQVNPAPQQTAAVRPTPLVRKSRYGCSI